MSHVFHTSTTSCTVVSTQIEVWICAWNRYCFSDHTEASSTENQFVRDNTPTPRIVIRAIQLHSLARALPPRPPPSSLPSRPSQATTTSIVHHQHTKKQQHIVCQSKVVLRRSLRSVRQRRYLQARADGGAFGDGGRDAKGRRRRVGLRQKEGTSSPVFTPLFVTVVLFRRMCRSFSWGRGCGERRGEKRL